ncbi:serine-rich adhesin for platelets-like [Saccostrea cucullata]|uniref:serine-rich adhesin for platelets-like n=1 Tax=Saccostrea cuccullata TaxID=36930 RepID=UPI002ED5BCC5
MLISHECPFFFTQLLVSKTAAKMKGITLCLLCLLCSVISVMSFMKSGTSPSSPNDALRNCMKNVGYYSRTPNRYRNKFSNSVWKWCSVHRKVLPCVERSLESNSLRSPSDWFFSMTFDSTMARRTSVAMCNKLKKFGKKLKCIKSSSLKRAKRCVKSLTMPLRQTLTEMYLQNTTNGHDARRLACIISAATATCYKEKIRSCRGYLRDYIGAYHVILGGKCLSVLKTSDEFVDDSIIMPRQADRNWVSIVQSILKDVGIDHFPKSLLSEIQTTRHVSSQEIQSTTTLSQEIPSIMTSSQEIQSATSTQEIQSTTSTSSQDSQPMTTSSSKESQPMITFPQKIQSQATIISSDIQSTFTASSEEFQSNANSTSLPSTNSFEDDDMDLSNNSRADEQTPTYFKEKENTQTTTVAANGNNSADSEQKSNATESTTSSDEIYADNSEEKIIVNESPNNTLSTDSGVNAVNISLTQASSSLRSSSPTLFLSSLLTGSLFLSVLFLSSD